MKINAIVTGATGMVGKAVLLECLENDAVASVLVVGRREVGIAHPKLKEVVVPDFSKLDEIKAELAGHNACFFCLGVSSLGMNEADYRKITYDLTLNFAEALVGICPEMTFCYVSGSGTNATGKSMWARVKGETENALLALPFKAAFMFRPAYIHPMKGVKSGTGIYNALLMVTKFLYPVIRAVIPKYTTTSENVGIAAINIALHGDGRQIVESNDINRLAKK